MSFQDKAKNSPYIRRRARIAAALALMLLLTGCSRERTETRREIQRIQQAANAMAEQRAKDYISEKYGIEASAEGYWVQAYDDFFAPYVSTGVVVFMEYGERKFCVGIDVDDETILWDNYRREEIEAALQAYFTELYSLPPPYTAKTEFRLENAPDYLAATPAEWRKRGYDHRNMVDFCFQGQTAEEMLARISRLEFHDAWLTTEQLLEPLSFQDKDWPLCEGGYVEWNLRVYSAPEAKYVDQSTDHPDIAGFPYFTEWRQARLRDNGTQKWEQSGDFWSFRSVQADGILFISRLPSEIKDILRVCTGGPSMGTDSMEVDSAEEGMVIEESKTIEEGSATEDGAPSDVVWSIDRGDSGIQTYRLVSNVYEVTEGAPDSYYATVIHLPREFTDQYPEPLYILSRSKETGKVEVRKYISPQEELDALPEDEFNRDYKIHSNSTCGMSAGYQYAVAEKIEMP